MPSNASSNAFRVAPFTGAWIEIACKWPPALYGGPVAPFTGAWIEIRNLENPKVTKTESHPSRVRGLKSIDAVQEILDYESHPSRVRGLKFMVTQDSTEKTPGRTLHGCVD